MGYSNIKIIDIVLDNFNELTDEYDMYFVVTPFTTHYEVLTKLSKFKNKKIWCEKPLIDTYDEANDMYYLMERNGNKLFVDWVYTFNPCVDKIRKIVTKKKIKQVILNRTNDGPTRFDTDSIHDLSSHDLSILYHVFGRSNFDFKWNEFSVKSNEDCGSNISWYYKNGLQVIINSSWQHKTKNRVSLFITEDDEIIVFDDVKKTIVTSKGLEDFSEYPSPLQLAIKHFVVSSEFEANKELTLKITKNLENAI
jgi:predicted dehydrogenase